MAAIDAETILLAAGGTGGHIYPAEALAEKLKEKRYNVHLITDERYENYSTQNIYDQVHVLKTGRSGGGLFSTMFGAFGAAMGIMSAQSILRAVRPSAVVGFGGYPSFPAVMAANMASIPTMIHEQNALLGRANRMLSLWTNKIASSFKTVHRVPKKASPKVVFTGNPVRKTIQEARETGYKRPGGSAPFRLLVIGGSQGAHSFSEVVPNAIEKLSTEIKQRMKVTQQSIKEDIDQVTRAYQSMDIEATIEPFFEDLAGEMRKAHLVISRAGASSIAELTTIGRPAILVPYPYAMDDHQTLNAQPCEEAGGAIVMQQEDFTSIDLAEILDDLIFRTSKLESMAQSMFTMGVPKAAQNLLEEVEDLISK